MGIVFLGPDGPLVLEAVEPVKMTALNQWVARGQGHHFVAKRLRDAPAVLTPAAIAKLRGIGDTFIGKHYDLVFAWSDDRMYCSELVWKVYDRALDLEIGHPQHLSEFDLSDPGVHAKVVERWHGPVPPDEVAISPGQMFASSLLKTIYEQ